MSFVYFLCKEVHQVYKDQNGRASGLVTMVTMTKMACFQTLLNKINKITTDSCSLIKLYLWSLNLSG